MALIVFVCDMLSSRPFRPMSVLVFCAAGAYCIVLIKQQRMLERAEQGVLLVVVVLFFGVLSFVDGLVVQSID